MPGFVSDIAFTPSVKEAQSQRGSRRAYHRMAEKQDWPSSVTPDLAAFIAERDSFYLATANAAGQPYIQHRGGPKGFIKVLDEKTLGLADLGGNKQYVTLGNLAENVRAFIFLMDYANRRRVKLWGRAETIESDPALLSRLTVAGYQGQPERALLFHLEAWDANCPQHITPRYDETVVAQATQKLVNRIAQLEAEVGRLKDELSAKVLK